ITIVRKAGCRSPGNDIPNPDPSKRKVSNLFIKYSRAFSMNSQPYYINDPRAPVKGTWADVEEGCYQVPSGRRALGASPSTANDSTPENGERGPAGRCYGEPELTETGKDGMNQCVAGQQNSLAMAETGRLTVNSEGQPSKELKGGGIDQDGPNSTREVRYTEVMNADQLQNNRLRSLSIPEIDPVAAPSRPAREER
ncbi:hypothetical protein GOP47_0008687, partial [Adiantum capillus-veneris]